MLEYMADINVCVLYMCMCCVCCRCVCTYVQLSVVVCVSLSIQYKCTRLSVQECLCVPLLDAALVATAPGWSGQL